MSEEKPPDPVTWWWHRRIQSYVGIAGLFALAALAIYFPVSDASTDLLGYAGMGFLLLIAQYMGSSVCDIIRAWKGQ